VTVTPSLSTVTVTPSLSRGSHTHEHRRTRAERTRAALRSGLYDGPQQVGFARVVSDCVDFAWLCDVFLDETIRGRNLGKWLMQTIVAHGLYEQFGFVPIANPMVWMERPANS
jgi:GNAT superfamily N-acetyltransferase